MNPKRGTLFRNDTTVVFNASITLELLESCRKLGFNIGQEVFRVVKSLRFMFHEKDPNKMSIFISKNCNQKLKECEIAIHQNGQDCKEQ